MMYKIPEPSIFLKEEFFSYFFCRSVKRVRFWYIYYITFSKYYFGRSINTSFFGRMVHIDLLWMNEKLAKKTIFEKNKCYFTSLCKKRLVVIPFSIYRYNTISNHILFFILIQIVLYDAILWWNIKWVYLANLAFKFC